MRAPVRPFDIIDLVGLKFEAEVNPETPEELFAGIPESETKVNDVVRKAVSTDLWRHETGDLKGVYKVDEQLYKEVPTIPRLAPHGPRKVSSNSQSATRGSSALTSRKR